MYFTCKNMSHHQGGKFSFQIDISVKVVRIPGRSLIDTCSLIIHLCVHEGQEIKIFINN